MACQSLDNDEILNVRWATEDPNPESKVAEKRRLEDMGREAIQSKMDPKIIEAMRAVRALEEGVEYQDEGPEIEEMDDDDEEGRGAKRPRLALENGDDDEEEVPMPESEAPKASGLLSADTLESLKYFTEIRKRQANGASVVQSTSAPKPPPPAGLGLADYGSDEDD